MTKTCNHVVRDAGHWIVERMPDGVCFAHSPPRGLTFAIDEPLLMAVCMVLDGVEPYTSRVALEALGQSDESGVWWSLYIGDIVIDMSEGELADFTQALEAACDGGQA